MDGYMPTEADKKHDLLRHLQTRDFTGAQNHFIKKEIDRLYEVCQVGLKDGSDAASRLLEQIFVDNGFEIWGDDNEFCYALGDKITIYMGGTPSPHYEE